jgi:hypothetical protein
MSIANINLGKKASNHKLLTLYAFFAGLFVAVGISLFGNISAAWACDGPGFCEGIPGGGGATNPGPGNPAPAPGPGPRPAKYVKSSSYASSADATYQVNCVNGYAPGTTCSVNEGAIKNAPGTIAPREAYGYQYQGGGKNLVTLVGNPRTCAPNGDLSAYAQTWKQWISTAGVTEIDYRLGKDENLHPKWIPFTTTRETGKMVYYQFSGCVYPTKTYQYTTCFWNFGGNSHYSINKNNANWALFSNRPRLGSDPAAPSGGSGQTPPSGRCADGRGTNIYVQNNVQPNDMGYYSVTVSYNYRLYTREAWKRANGSEVYSPGWKASSALSNSSTGYWVYSCNSTGNPVEGRFGSKGAIPNRDNFMNPATCPQVSWQCKLGTPTTFGLDRAAVTSGRLSPTTTASAMRNGEKVNIDFANVRVVDTSTARDIDVTDGGTSPGVRNISNIAYKTNVKTGSTPFYGTDPNASIQYFKYFANRGNTSIEKFGSWYNKNNSNLDKAMSFNWASESSSQGFVVQRQYRVSGEFFIPAPPLIPNGSSAGGSPGGVWKPGTYDCKDYSGRGANRVDRGILTSSSNPLTVVRATNK